MGFPFQIVQTPNQTSILYECAHTVRDIFMNSQPSAQRRWQPDKSTESRLTHVKAGQWQARCFSGRFWKRRGDYHFECYQRDLNRDGVRPDSFAGGRSIRTDRPLIDHRKRSFSSSGGQLRAVNGERHRRALVDAQVFRTSPSRLWAPG